MKNKALKIWNGHVWPILLFDPTTNFDTREFEKKQKANLFIYIKGSGYQASEAGIYFKCSTLLVWYVVFFHNALL